MSDTEMPRRWEEGPRVRVKTRVVRRGDAGRPTTDPIRSGLRSAEHRFLGLQSRTASGTTPQVLAEFLAILADLQDLGRRLQDIAVRRDLTYLAARRLGVLDHHCLWLARRVSAEFLLVLQIHLEQELRRLISPQAYQIFLHLEEVSDAARELEGLRDDDVMAKLREGTLMREVFDRVWLGDVFAGEGHLDPGTAADQDDGDDHLTP